jgi:hypothetical protein
MTQPSPLVSAFTSAATGGRPSKQTRPRPPLAGRTGSSITAAASHGDWK